MKRIFAFILLLCFATQVFSQSVIIAGFYINRAYIAKNLCENRYRPMLHCNGQCILAKKLKQQEKKEQQAPELKLKNIDLVISSRSFFSASLSAPAYSYPGYSLFQVAEPTDRSFSIFHPPCFS